MTRFVPSHSMCRPRKEEWRFRAKRVRARPANGAAGDVLWRGLFFLMPSVHQYPSRTIRDLFTHKTCNVVSKRSIFKWTGGHSFQTRNTQCHARGSFVAGGVFGLAINFHRKGCKESHKREDELDLSEVVCDCLPHCHGSSNR